MSPAATAVLAASCLLAAGAAAQMRPAAAQEIEVVDDSFLPYREYRTRQARISQHPNLIGVRLIGRRDRKTGALRTFLKVEFAYIAARRRHYHSARNTKAQPLRLTRISASGNCGKRSSCAHDEIFTVAIPVHQLRRAPASGYRLKLFSKVGTNATVAIPKAVIGSLFARIDAGRR